MNLLYRAALLFAILLFAGCAPVQMKGVNLLQSRNVALDDIINVENMQNLKKLGANTVAFVPFIRQSTVTSCDLAVDEFYSLERLHRAVEYAHLAGLRVILKPQILVPGSWAGEIAPASEAGWDCWFNAYTQRIIELAEIAKDGRIEMLIVGTELHKTESRKEWRTLVDKVRAIYSGQLSYVSHDIQDLAKFAALDKVDSVAITYYPRLAEASAGISMREQMKQLSQQIKREAAKLNKPFWIAEIGITSRSGALNDPWLWPEQFAAGTVADPELQARVLDGWMAELSGDWHQGILIWNWYSDAKAGGMNDIDFTIQNKPATQAVSCHWTQRCH